MLRRNKKPLTGSIGLSRFPPVDGGERARSASMCRPVEASMFFDAFVQSQKALDLWTRLTQEQLVRMGEMAKQADVVGGQATVRTREAIDETARLMKASLDYASDLGAEWRRITLDVANQVTSQAAPAAASAAKAAPKA
jgi:hypothetical protein